MRDYQVSQRRACVLIGVDPKTVRRELPPDHAGTLAEVMADSGHYSIDSTTVRAHVSAAGGKGGLIDALLAARGVGSRVSFTAWLMPSDGHSPSI